MPLFNRSKQRRRGSATPPYKARCACTIASAASTAPRAGWVREINMNDHPLISKVNVLGAKGVGESGCTASLPALVTAALDAVRPLGIDHLDMPLTAQDKERFVTFLVSEGYLDKADHAYKKNSGRGPGDPHDFKALLQSGFANRIRSVLDGTGQAPMFQPIGGIDNFPKGFQRKLGEKIQLNSEVMSIRQSEDSVKVAYKNTKSGAVKEITADYCISCLPLTILRNMEVNISPELMTAVKNTPYSPSAKIGLQMKRRFWEEDDGIYGGHLYSNLPFGEFSYPSTGYFGDKGVLLGFYGNGQMAGVINMPVKGRIEHVLTHASKVHPQIRQEFDNGYCVFWEKMQYSMGAFAAGGGGGPGSLDAGSGFGWPGASQSRRTPARRGPEITEV